MTLNVLQPQPRPKLLNVVVVPTGGWTLRFQVEIASVLTNVNATIPAGDYYVAFDQQSDDFIWKLATVMSAAANTATGGTAADIGIYLNSSNKVVFSFADTWYVGAAQDGITLSWTFDASSTSIGEVLGFDTSANDSSTGVNNPTITGDYQHAYGWYSDEDGQLVDDFVEDSETVEVFQSIGPSGHSKAQFIGARGTNVLGLKWLARVKTFSRRVAYAGTPVWPYGFNVPLECFWREARQGKRFRVYRDGQISTTRIVQRGVPTSTSTTTWTDTGKAWTIAPAQQFKGMLLYTVLTGLTVRSFITSHTATVITFPNAIAGAFTVSGAAYYIMDQKYSEYTLDLEKMKTFEPKEITNLDEYEISLPLLRYQA